MGTVAGNDQLFAELSKERPNYALIRSLLNSGQADINAVQKKGDSLVTAFWFIQGGLGKQTVTDRFHPSGKQPLMWVLEHPYYKNNDFESRLAQFKAYFYPLLDILEEYGFDIMNGSRFRLQPDGTKTHRMHAGFRFLDLEPFRIMAKHDVPRIIKFFERLYFSRGYAANDPRSTEMPGFPGISYLRPLLGSAPSSYKPELILYMIMKGADWRHPYYIEHNFIKNFATQVVPDQAAKMIAMLQQLLGVDYIKGPQGANLRGFLAAAYDTVNSVYILEKANNILALKKRSHVLLMTPMNIYLPENNGAAAGAGGHIGGRKVKRRKRRTLKHRKRRACDL